jgi:enamine deaminase RidA (YjgF/YER057c/UK114 family)
MSGKLHPLQRIATGLFVLVALLSQLSATRADDPPLADGRYLYVVCPGIRNYPEFGGAGILVFDIDNGHKFVRRSDTPASREPKPDNIKGVCACAATGRLYFTTRSKLYCVDLATGKTIWETTPPNGTDRMSITPDGKILYVPSFEKDTWNVIDAADGKLITPIETKSGAHNTVVGLDGSRMYLGGLKSPFLFVADTKTHTVAKKVGPFGGAIRPFTVNGAQTRAYICVNDLLGFEIGDLTTDKVIHRVEVAGFKKGPVKRHGCPSHGIGLTPDEKEVWVVDAFNQMVHVFDNTVSPPKQGTSIKLREQPGWVTFSLDGKYAYPSTGEVIDTATKKIIAALTDEKGREVHSEKMVEVHFKGGKPVANGDQFGVGRVGARLSYHRLGGLDTHPAAVGDAPLLHTTQLLPVGDDGQLLGGTDARKQTEAVLDRLVAVLTRNGSNVDHVARLHFVATTPAVAEAGMEVVRGSSCWKIGPPVAVVLGRTVRADCLVAVDAVAVAANALAVDSETSRVLQTGPRVFISGQAEKGSTPAEAAAKTIASLKRTLDWLGCRPEDAVQAKCFLTPMSAAEAVLKEFDNAFGPGRIPLVFVEWKSTLPIEIELVAKVPPPRPDAPAVEYLTPPWMKGSPVYAKVVRVNRGDLIYTAGLTSPKPGSGADEVNGVFDELRSILDKTGSDFQHLVKATYYVSSENSSRQLNELRPKFYDPKRPPAASKAFVPGVGREGRTLMMDMIAVRVK